MMSKTETSGPYVGPMPFDERDRYRFFGRHREGRDIVSLVVAHRAVLLYAQSGAGKTSLLNASVLPALREEQFSVLPTVRLSGVLPESVDPAQVGNFFAFNALLAWMDLADSPERYARTTMAEFLADKRLRGTEWDSERPVALVFDQFEELFSAHIEHWRERQGFFEQVAEALDDPLIRVIFAVREDYLAQVDEFSRLLPDGLRARYRLERLGSEAALEAITKPLEPTGRKFAEGVAEGLVERLRKVKVETGTGQTTGVLGQYVEPVQLQIVCSGLWAALPDNVREINAGHVAQFGDVDRALSEFFNSIIHDLVAELRINEDELRETLELVLVTSTGTRSIVHRGPESTGGLPNEVFFALEKRHLVSSEWRAGAHWYELTHDCLLNPIQASNERWRRFRMEQTDKALSLCQRSHELMDKGKSTEALRLAREAQALSEAVGHWQLVGFSLKLIGDLYTFDKRGLRDLRRAFATYRGALAIYEKLNDLHGQATLLFVLGVVAHDLERFDVAAEFYSRYISLFPEDPRGYENRGCALWYAGRHDEATGEFDYALSINPESFVALSGRGQVLGELGRFVESIDDLKQALALPDQDPVSKAYARNGIALALGGLGKYQDSLREFEASIEGAPDNGWVYFNRAKVHEVHGEFDKAVSDLNTALHKFEPPLTPGKRIAAKAAMKRLRGHRCVILLTGFGPFGSLDENPSETAVREVERQRETAATSDVFVVVEVLPTEYEQASQRMNMLLEGLRPNAIICVGVSQNSEAFLLECEAANMNNAESPDESGEVRVGRVIVVEGPAVYGSTLPLDAMAQELGRAGIPSHSSNDAGGYVCNHVFYVARHLLEQMQLPSPCGLIHIPAMTERSDKGEVQRGLPLAILTEGVRRCLGIVEASLLAT